MIEILLGLMGVNFKKGGECVVFLSFYGLYSYHIIRAKPIVLLINSAPFPSFYCFSGTVEVYTSFLSGEYSFSLFGGGYLYINIKERDCYFWLDPKVTKKSRLRLFATPFPRFAVAPELASLKQPVLRALTPVTSLNATRLKAVRGKAALCVGMADTGGSFFLFIFYLVFGLFFIEISVRDLFCINNILYICIDNHGRIGPFE